MMEINYVVSPDENLVMVNIGASITSISVIVGGITIFTRSIPMGGNQFTEEIQRRFNINFKDAEDAKTGAEVAGVDATDFEDVIASVLSNLTGEIKRSMDFFLAGSQDLFISKIILSGGGSMTKGLLEMLQEKSGLNVEFVDPFNNIDVANKEINGKPLQDVAPVFAVAVGLATRRLGDR
jgi:type IV pilus assembly protein PilM